MPVADGLEDRGVPRARAPRSGGGSAQREPRPEREPEQQRAEGDLEPQQEALVGAALDLDLVHDLVAGDEQAARTPRVVVKSRFSASTSSHTRRRRPRAQRAGGCPASSPRRRGRRASRVGRAPPSGSPRRRAGGRAWRSRARRDHLAPGGRAIQRRARVDVVDDENRDRDGHRQYQQDGGPGARATRRGIFTPSESPVVTSAKPL